MPGAANEQRAAGGAVRVGGFAENISLIDKVQAGFERNLAGAVERFRRSAGLIAQFEVRMERGEVQRDVGAEMVEDPVGEPPRLAGVVVERGNDEVGDLEPDGCFALEPEERIENGLEVGERGFAVEIFGERFEVDICGVNVIINIMEGFAGDVAVRNHDALKAVGCGGGADIDDVLAPDGRLVVGEGEGIAALLEGEQRNILRRNFLRADLVGAGFGNIPILAEEAAHVASGGAHAEDARAGKKMIERLFFDGIDLQGGGRTVAKAVQRAAFVDADEAEASLSGADAAVARTEKTVDAAVGLGFPPAGAVEFARFLQDAQLVHGKLVRGRIQDEYNAAGRAKQRGGGAQVAQGGKAGAELPHSKRGSGAERREQRGKAEQSGSGAEGKSGSRAPALQRRDLEETAGAAGSEIDQRFESRCWASQRRRISARNFSLSLRIKRTSAWLPVSSYAEAQRTISVMMGARSMPLSVRR